jgi:hypothetical protein
MDENRETKKARNQAGWSRAFLAGVIRDAFVPNDGKDAGATRSSARSTSANAMSVPGRENEYEIDDRGNDRLTSKGLVPCGLHARQILIACHARDRRGIIKKQFGRRIAPIPNDACGTLPVHGRTIKHHVIAPNRAAVCGYVRRAQRVRRRFVG